MKRVVPLLVLLLVFVLAVISIGLLSSDQLLQPSTNPPSADSGQASKIRVGPETIYPDSSRTPGAVNPEINEGTIDQTICNPEWSTRLIRPPSSYTSALKRRQMQELGLTGQTGDYEEDHLISLELGGHPTDPRNLWPEPYEPRPGAREKDEVENYLHRQVCSGAMSLRDAQRAIADDWYGVYLQIHR
jgi:hypothetical protein